VSDQLQHWDLLREIVAGTSWKIRIKVRAVSLFVPYLDLDGEPMSPGGEIISKKEIQKLVSTKFKPEMRPTTNSSLIIIIFDAP
jgi:hypothetical protein